MESFPQNFKRFWSFGLGPCPKGGKTHPHTSTRPIATPRMKAEGGCQNQQKGGKKGKGPLGCNDDGEEDEDSVPKGMTCPRGPGGNPQNNLRSTGKKVKWFPFSNVICFPLIFFLNF